MRLTGLKEIDFFDLSVNTLRLLSIFISICFRSFINLDKHHNYCFKLFTETKISIFSELVNFDDGNGNLMFL